MSGKKLDLGAKLRSSMDARRELGNIVPVDLIPGSEAANVGDRAISVDLIDLSPYQPRLTIDLERIEALADSIKAIGGIIQPIVVRPKADGRYELVAGERRLRAFRLCGFREIPAIERHLSDNDAFRMCAIENLQRENLEQYEIAKTLRRFLKDEICKNNSELSRLTGIARPDVINYLHFFDLPQSALDILETAPGLIGRTSAVELAGLARAGHEELVTAAVLRVRDGKTLNSKASKWVLSQLAGLPMRQSKREYANSEGQRLGTISRNKNRLSISIEDEALLESVDNLLDQFMLNAAQHGTASDIAVQNPSN